MRRIGCGIKILYIALSLHQDLKPEHTLVAVTKCITVIQQHDSTICRVICKVDSH